jgi:hypothetical protein
MEDIRISWNTIHSKSGPDHYVSYLFSCENLWFKLLKKSMRCSLISNSFLTFLTFRDVYMTSFLVEAFLTILLFSTLKNANEIITTENFLKSTSFATKLQILN